MTEEKLIVLNNPKSPITEAYRILRTNIQFSSLDKPLKTVLITSPGPNEGKSLTTANLAATFAQSGQQVLIIDGDLRRPTQHKIFGLKNLKGLTNILLGEVSLEEALQSPEETSGLKLLTTGPLPPNPAELLGSQRMKQLIKSISDISDVVFIDTPPVVAVTDAALLAAEVDGVLLVLGAGEARIEMAKKAKELLSNVKANILGTILNKISTDGHDYYYYYYYGDDKKKRRKQKPHIEAATLG